MTAIRYIQQHDQAGIRITAEQVAAVTIISRRGLDGKFCKLLGHTVAAEISRRQIKRALTLLERTNPGLTEIASRTGFKTISYLSRVIRDHTGRPPLAYRKWMSP